MKIGIIGAMDEEIAIIKSELAQTKQHEVAKQVFTAGNFQNHEIILLKCGIGKVNAAIGTTLLLDEHRPDCIINTGVAGGLDTQLNVGDIVISSEVRYHDVDLTAFGYEFGQMARMPASFLPDDKLIKIAEKNAAKASSHKTIKGLIVSGDSFIHNQKRAMQIKTHFNGACAVEMEACAIAQVCYLFKTPFVIIRSVSDTPKTNNSAESSEQFLHVAAKESASLVLAMLGDLQ